MYTTNTETTKMAGRRARVRVRVELLKAGGIEEVGQARETQGNEEWGACMLSMREEMVVVRRTQGKGGCWCGRRSRVLWSMRSKRAMIIWQLIHIINGYFLLFWIKFQIFSARKLAGFSFVSLTHWKWVINIY